MRKYIIVIGISLVGITAMKAQVPGTEIIPTLEGFDFVRGGEVQSCEFVHMDASRNIGFYFPKPIFNPQFVGGNIDFDIRHSVCPTLTLGNIDFKVNDVTKLFISGSNGQVGINTTTPQAQLDVKHIATSGWGHAIKATVNHDYTKALTVVNTTTNPEKEVFIVYGNGVLSTKKIFTEKIEVTMGAMGYSWYDHVFNEDYKFLSLSELEQFIKTNKHLPEIPSEKEVKENGLDLGDISGKLLLKIEELTLYIIELQKQIDELKQTKGGE